jgi:hypothetical protein
MALRGCNAQHRAQYDGDGLSGHLTARGVRLVRCSATSDRAGNPLTALTLSTLITRSNTV